MGSGERFVRRVGRSAVMLGKKSHMHRILNDGVLKLAPWKIVTRTFCSVLDIAMANNMIGRNVVGFLKASNETDERFHLARGNALAVLEIAHQTNTDTDFVHISDIAMSAVNLLHPSIPYLYFAVTVSAGAVADHKMIAKPIPKSALAMFAIENFSATGRRRTMVNDDIFPIARSG